MSVKAKSAKGEMVDFDLLKIKEQIAAAPAPTDVKARQSFVDKRLRRRLKKTSPIAPKIQKEDANVSDLPQPEELNQEPKMIDDVPTENPENQTNTKQKARPKKTKNENKESNE